MSPTSPGTMDIGLPGIPGLSGPGGLPAIPAALQMIDIPQAQFVTDKTPQNTPPVSPKEGGLQHIPSQNRMRRSPSGIG
eukprot:gene37366-25449_t